MTEPLTLNELTAVFATMKTLLGRSQFSYLPIESCIFLQGTMTRETWDKLGYIEKVSITVFDLDFIPFNPEADHGA